MSSQAKLQMTDTNLLQTELEYVNDLFIHPTITFPVTIQWATRQPFIPRLLVLN